MVPFGPVRASLKPRTEPDGLGEGATDLVGSTDGSALRDGVGDPVGVCDGVAVPVGVTEADGDGDGECEWLGDGDGDGEWEWERLGEGDGDGDRVTASLRNVPPPAPKGCAAPAPTAMTEPGVGCDGPLVESLSNVMYVDAQLSDTVKESRPE